MARRGVLIDNGTPYIRYENVYKPSEKWNLAITPEESMKHVCTYAEDYQAAWAYGEKVKAYINKLETEVARCHSAGR